MYWMYSLRAVLLSQFSFCVISSFIGLGASCLFEAGCVGSGIIVGLQPAITWDVISSAITRTSGDCPGDSPFSFSGSGWLMWVVLDSILWFTSCGVDKCFRYDIRFRETFLWRRSHIFNHGALVTYLNVSYKCLCSYLSEWIVCGWILPYFMFSICVTID